MKLTRRDFLIATALGLTSGKIVVDELIKYNKDRTLEDIYYELPKHVYMAKAECDLDDGLGGITHKEMAGHGIIVNQKFITPAHITTFDNVYVTTPFGTMLIPQGKETNRKLTLDGKVLEEVYHGDITKDDIDIYNLHPDSNLPDFPCKPRTHVKLGEPVYIIGDPQLYGTSIRKGYVSDVDGVDLKKLNMKLAIQTCFGIDKSIIPGDSGTPIVSEDYKLLGIADISLGVDRGYVTYIKEYLKRMDTIRMKVTTK